MKALVIAVLVSVLLGAEGLEAQQRLDSLLIYGEGFIFSVKEPEGWVADTKHAAAFEANVLLHPEGQAWQSTDGLIRVRVGKKTDEKIEEDLAVDMLGYRSQFPRIQFKDIPVSHSAYRVYPKLFFVSNDFYEYVVYVNPGPQSSLMFSVSMNKQKQEASKSEMAAFNQVVATLLMLKAPQPGAPADAR